MLVHLPDRAVDSINLVVTGLGTCRLPALRQGLKRLQGFLAAAPRGKYLPTRPRPGDPKGAIQNQSIYCAAAGRTEVRTEIADLLKKKAQDRIGLDGLSYCSS